MSAKVLLVKYGTICGFLGYSVAGEVDPERCCTFFGMLEILAINYSVLVVNANIVQHMDLNFYSILRIYRMYFGSSCAEM